MHTSENAEVNDFAARNETIQWIDSVIPGKQALFRLNKELKNYLTKWVMC